MNTSQIKNFAIQSRNILKAGVMNRILTLGFDKSGNLTVNRPVKIQGGTVFMDQLREESFYDAWIALETRLAKHGIKDVCEEAAYTWFNRLMAIRIMQKNHFVEPVMQYVSHETRIPVIVDQARSGRLSLRMTAEDKAKLEDLLRDSTKTNEQFNLLITAFCQSNPVIFNCFGGIEKHISLLLPDNILSQGGFIDLLNNTSYLTDEDYTKSELIGWLYQFYISEKKDEVFAKKGKYDPDEIPAATQIFTPNWIVKYMAENTIGRIYLDNNPYADEIKASMTYLVDSFEPTPKDAILKLDDLTEYKMIDNACGSGHILIEGFNLFYRMYMYEGYATRTAIENILTKNIIGIDLDTRAKQLAAFALLMTAARLDKSFLDCKVMPRVLDFPEPFDYRGGTMEDFLPHYFLGGNQKIIKETIKAFELLKDADTLGSIMKFDISAETRSAIKRSTDDWEKQEFVNSDIKAAIPSMKIILALTNKYSVAVMNPPYMGSGAFNDVLSSYTREHYFNTKADLGTVFMDVAHNLVESKGLIGMINQSAWANKSSYNAYRLWLTDNVSITTLLDLGSGTFDEIKGEVVQSLCFVLRKDDCLSRGRFFNLSAYSTSKEKEDAFFSDKAPSYFFDIRSILNIPSYNLCYWLSSAASSAFKQGTALGLSNSIKKGLATGKDSLFLRLWYEVSSKHINYSCCDLEENEQNWITLCKGGGYRKWFGNNDYVIYWKNNGEAIKNFRASDGSLLSRPQNLSHMLKEAISYNIISSREKGFVGRYLPPHLMMTDVAPNIYGKNQLVLLGFLDSTVGRYFCRILCPSYKYETGYIGQIPILNEVYSVSADSIKDNIDISRKDWDAHETSWDFKKNELIRAQILCGQNCADIDMLNEHEIVELKDSVPTDNRLISHCIWAYKNDWTRSFNQLHSNEEELNRKFIEIYGLQDELTPDVPMDEITILQQGEISIKNNQIVWHDDVIVKQFISYAIGCWMGRYRLDLEGLYIAHYPTDDEVCTYNYKRHSFEIDDDAIIPLMGTNNPFEDDNALQKLINFIKIVFGEETITENLNHIEHCLGKSLENYLIKDFWKDHKKMYQNRPIYWLFSSSKGAFQVLTYMHRMNPYTAERIRTKYLLPYIDYLKGRIEVDEARGAELSSVERQNLAKMKTALEECNEYHDRLHEVAIKAIDFDLDDGVLVNYAKFGDVLAKIK